MIHLFVLQNLSIILVFEGKWKMSISFKGRYLYSVLLVLKGFFFFFYSLPPNHLEASSFKSKPLPNSPFVFWVVKYHNIMGNMFQSSPADT